MDASDDQLCNEIDDLLNTLGEIWDKERREQRAELREPLLLPAPSLYVSKAADSLDAFHGKEHPRHWRSRDRACRVGDYVAMVGLAASTCGLLRYVDERKNFAMVEWFILDGDHWRKYYVSCYCRWSDLCAAYDHLKRRALSLTNGEQK